MVELKKTHHLLNTLCTSYLPHIARKWIMGGKPRGKKVNGPPSIINSNIIHTTTFSCIYHHQHRKWVAFVEQILSESSYRVSPNSASLIPSSHDPFHSIVSARKSPFARDSFIIPLGYTVPLRLPTLLYQHGETMPASHRWARLRKNRLPPPSMQQTIR